MGTKESLLALFEAKKGVYFSGEELAEQLSVSRTAVWKAVNALRVSMYIGCFTHPCPLAPQVARAM